MKEKIKKYKYIILVVLIILGFLFYWYEIRPSQIRKRCSHHFSVDNRSLEAMEVFYKACLNSWGIYK